ncbi:hypothetical protein Mp_Vg00080 [Marchantia polymorpha subsp. ruderalis]|uniref:Uncharacterized protein n=1 Tax=Marchantia polymorpha TaxID=3197 RepID=A0A2R6VWY5_MARPO|nr:hypothetical protein MARPO_YB0045 [Marchantia polymorpha]BBN20449.1 hypothetical protein Mp_Vg00080 [Marchantia polymorpha subsp. ruderalis]|eukprot:PTQ26104.1 hypothetical protein MARPO_YB0045 [Marchantia polymorpha]
MGRGTGEGATARISCSHPEAATALPKQKARRRLLPASSAETATIATEKGSPSPKKDGTARTAEGSADHPMPSAEATPCGRRFSPTHRRAPTHRQDSPPVQRKKGKERAEDPPSAQGPSGQGPSAVRSPGYAPTAPGPSGHRVTNKEPAAAVPSARNPPEGAPLAEVPSGQWTSGGPPSAQPPSAVDAFGATASAEAPLGIAPTHRPDASLEKDLMVERDLTEERIDCPQGEICARDAQLHSA